MEFEHPYVELNYTEMFTTGKAHKFYKKLANESKEFVKITVYSFFKVTLQKSEALAKTDAQICAIN